VQADRVNSVLLLPIKLIESDNLKDLILDGRIIILNKHVIMWTGFSRTRTQFRGCLLLK
jgi:hypothetical protein